MCAFRSVAVGSQANGDNSQKWRNIKSSGFLLENIFLYLPLSLRFD